MATTKLNVTVPFVKYYNDCGGASIKVDVHATGDELHIYNKSGEIVKSISIGRSAYKAGFELQDMLKVSHKNGEYSFGVLLNGYMGQDWLCAVEVLASF